MMTMFHGDVQQRQRQDCRMNVRRTAGRNPTVWSSQSKYLVVRLPVSRYSRSEHPDPYLFLPAPLRGLWRGLNGVGR